MTTAASISSPMPCPLTVVIPTYNRKDLLHRCLSRLFSHLPKDAEVIVVDDGSTDGTAEEVKQHWPAVRLLSNDRNQGFCYSANRGWKSARGAVVELLNNDAEVTAGWATAPLAEFNDPKVGFVAPLVRCLPFRRRIDSAGDLFASFGLARKRWEGRSWLDQKLVPEEVFSASASSAFYRRQALEDVGGFPEEYVAYFDDVDLGFRLRLAGYVCRFVPSSVVFHWVSQSHSIASRPMLSQVSANSERLFWTNLPARQLAVMAIPHFAYLLTLMAYKGLKGEFGPWFAGKCSLLLELPRLRESRRRAQRLAHS